MSGPARSSAGGHARRNAKDRAARDSCFVGSSVWASVEDESVCFELGEVLHISGDGKYTVRLAGDKDVVLTREAIKVTHENGAKATEDLLDLSDFSEQSLIHSLRERYKRDQFYSLVGPILISINPYKWCNIYSAETMQLYRGKNKAQAPPHAYMVAENAFRSLREQSGGNQAVIISGESGAGKTEATKIIMRYLSSAGYQEAAKETGQAAETKPLACSSSRSKKAKETDGPSGGIEKRVLDSNPLLEAFGNAKTLRNDNSSRFGKFIQIHMDSSGLISGAKVINYLLEKSRIIRQADGERNYHIFYQMFRGASADQLEEWGLGGLGEDDFEYISTGAGLTLSDGSDAKNFAAMQRCLASIGVAKEEQAVLFRTLAGILMTGNIDFDSLDEVEGCVTQAAYSATAAHLFGLSPDNLASALSTHLVQVGGDLIRKPILRQVARDKRDALSKAVYALIFRWLVQRINSSLAGRVGGGSGSSSMEDDDNGSGRFIGILDIYGFEVFRNNSFEQFCINFANEKLQRHFNKYIFEVEQEEYAKEGIDWSRIEFNDNQPCLDLIDTSQQSLLCLLDEECIMPKGSDASLLRKLTTQHNNRHAHFFAARFGDEPCFGIRHYAGSVSYCIEGFITKNNDSLSEELQQLMQSSQNKWVRDLFTPTLPVGGGRRGAARRLSSIRAPTVSQQFRRQLESLMTKLESCRPHFIRCVKPNEFKVPGDFHALKCLQQLRYAGMLETIRIRDQGYSLRERHDSFYRRFSLLAPCAKNTTELVSKLTQQFALGDASQWQLGTTKVFLRRELADKLDRFVGVRVSAASRTIARAFRETIFRKRKGAVLVLEAFYERVKFVLVLRKVLRIQCKVRCKLAKMRASEKRLAQQNVSKRNLEVYSVPANLVSLMESASKATPAKEDRATSPIKPKARKIQQPKDIVVLEEKAGLHDDGALPPPPPQSDPPPSNYAHDLLRLHRDVENARSERDAACRDRDHLLSCLEQARRERDQATGHHDEARSAAAKLAAELESLRLALEQTRTKLAVATAESNAKDAQHAIEVAGLDRFLQQARQAEHVSAEQLRAQQREIQELTKRAENERAATAKAREQAEDKAARLEVTLDQLSVTQGKLALVMHETEALRTTLVSSERALDAERAHLKQAQQDAQTKTAELVEAVDVVAKYTAAARMSVRRLQDCNSFVRAVWSPQGSQETASDSEGDPNTEETSALEMLTKTVSVLFSTVKQRIKQHQSKPQTGTVAALPAKLDAGAATVGVESETELKALLERQNQLLQRAFSEQTKSREDQYEKQQLKLERKIEAQLEEINTLRANMAQMRIELCDSRGETKASDTRRDEMEQKLTKAIAEVESTTRALELAKRSLNEKERGEKVKHEQAHVNKNINKLMTENVALLDEVLETRSKYQALSRKLQKVESRAVQAEAANETLVTLLSWRDNQLSALLRSKDPSSGAQAAPSFPAETEWLEKRIDDLKPYMAQISHYMGERLSTLETKDSAL